MLSEPGVEPRWGSQSRGSARVRRRILIGTVLGFVALFGLVALNDFMERRAIDYRSAEQIYAQLVREGFSCSNPSFPTGAAEPPHSSTATCERGFLGVRISVDQERGAWLKLGPDDYSEPWTSGAAFVRGRNWSVGFDAPPNKSAALAREVHAILGGELRHSLGQQDY